MLPSLRFCAIFSMLTALLGCGSSISTSHFFQKKSKATWQLASDVKIKRQNKGGFRDLMSGSQALAVGGGLYIVASCTGLDDHVTNLISLSGSGRMEVNDPNAGPSACGNPEYEVLIEGSNPLKITYKVNAFTKKVGIVNFTLDLEKSVTPVFGFLHANRTIEEGCANDWKPIDANTTKVSDIRSPCVIPHDVGRVGVARQKPPLLENTEAFLGGDEFRIENKIERVTILDARRKEVKVAEAPFSSDFGIFNHPGTYAFGSSFYGVPPGHSIELTQKISIFVKAK